MKNTFTLFLLLISLVSQGQSSSENKTDKLGIGIIAIATTKEVLDKFIFYKDKELKTLSKNVFTNKPDKNIYPKFYKSEEKICYFVCTENTSNYFKIVVNKSDEVYIVNDTNTVFKSWDLLLSKSKGVIRPDKQNLFRSEPSDMGAIVNLVSKDENYKVLAVKGDWIKVQNEKKQKEAWIRWRWKDRLLIEVLF